MDKDKIQNPILRGFHPDPSIIRVEEDYYIATSTFEWWPGIRLHHSRDLAHWKLIGYALDDPSVLDLKGVGPSQGIWAPCLTYDKGIFYLAYTVVKAFYCNMYDTENYLITASDIRGPWSEPIALNNFGFDPSMFHDDDGRKYMVGMSTDHRVPKKYAGRLVLQEYDPVKKKMTGPVRDIYKADRIFLEGPHIFKRNGWYYLFSADTGTGEGHGQTIQRSRSVWGPYEMYQADFMERRSEDEAYSILTSRHHEEILLQKSGHCDLVETPEGEWYAVHLCGRTAKREMRNPADAARFPGCRRYMLGRETAIQKMRWTEDDWLVLDCGGNTPQNEVEYPKRRTAGMPGTGQKAASEGQALAEQKAASEGQALAEQKTASERSALAEQKAAPEGEALAERKTTPERTALSEQAASAGQAFVRDDFDGTQLDLDYQSLRVPMDARYISLTERPGWLRMYGRSGLASRFAQTLIARRMTEYQMEASARMEFEPELFKQMAGLIMMYDTDNYLYLHVSHDEDSGKCITLLKAENRRYEYLTEYLPLEPGRTIDLKLRVDDGWVQFFFGYGEEELREIGPRVDGGFLSDEACDEGWFSGTMIGICCQDLTGFGKYADFDWFEVRP